MYRLLAKLQSKSTNPTGEIQIPSPTEKAIINETVDKARKQIVDKLSVKYSKYYAGSMESA